MSLLTRRSMMTHKSGGRLPAGYTERRYLESTGVQYIDTEKTMTQDMGMEIGFYDLRSTASGTVAGVYGGWMYSYANAFAIGYDTQDSTLKFYYGVPAVTTTALGGGSTGITIADSFSISYYKTSNSKYIEYSVNGGQPTTVSIRGFRMTNKPDLFAVNYYGSSKHLYGSVKITHYAHYDANGVCDQLFVPAVRDSDGKPGFYDLAGSICSLTGAPFYINSGTDADLIAGPPV